ncbi:hypothetical protein A7P95_03125 [Eikenella longinqua]|uniref:Uncharacterized protein n=1 Tax=Eikenella longinqua TaxID=1795827 RepID=A0A1A9RZY3_9NEIS|nr:hypothetical protein A7P95_03125 [Eikenella longinqua]
MNAGEPISATIRCIGRIIAQNTAPPANTSAQPARPTSPPSPPPATNSATPANASSPHSQ